jgi:hypothetical protein
MDGLLMLPRVLALMLPLSLGQVGEPPFGCYRDQIDEQIAALSSQVAAPATFAAAWQRLAGQADVMGIAQPALWEVYCRVFTVAWDPATGEGGQVMSQTAAATAVAARWPQLPAVTLPPDTATTSAATSPLPGRESVVGGLFAVNASPATPTSVALQWTGEPNAQVYEVTVASAQGVRLASRRVYPPGPSVSNVTTTISGLTPGSTYRFEVSALRTDGSSTLVEVARSLAVSATTPLAVVPSPTPFSTPGPERSRPPAPGTAR